MKNIILSLFIALAFAACIHTDESKEANAKMSMSLSTAPACDTLYTLEPYDSTFTVMVDSCYWKERRWRKGERLKCELVPALAHVTAYRSVIDTIICKVVQEPVTIQFGAKLQGKVDDQIEAAKALGVKYIRANSIELKSYTGDVSALKKWSDAGFKIILNVVWSEANPASFAKGKDLETFKAKLEQLIVDAGDMVEMYIVENEQTNTTFYDYTSNTIEDYLAELQAGISVCEKYQKQVSDGGLHIKLIEAISMGNLKKDNAIRQNQCIQFYKTITYKKFFVNVHTEFVGDVYVKDQVLKSCEYLRVNTGHEVISNEFHTEKCSPAFISITVNEWRKAGVRYCLIWGGNYVAGEPFPGGSEADAINKGKDTTAIGGAYKAAIK